MKQISSLIFNDFLKFLNFINFVQLSEDNIDVDIKIFDDFIAKVQRQIKGTDPLVRKSSYCTS